MVFSEKFTTTSSIPRFSINPGRCISHGIFHAHYTFFFFFWPRCVLCGILVPQQGIRPMPPALEAWSLNHWTTREVPPHTFFTCYLQRVFIPASNMKVDKESISIWSKHAHMPSVKNEERAQTGTMNRGWYLQGSSSQGFVVVFVFLHVFSLFLVISCLFL